MFLGVCLDCVNRATSLLVRNTVSVPATLPFALGKDKNSVRKAQDSIGFSLGFSIGSIGSIGFSIGSIGFLVRFASPGAPKDTGSPFET